MSYADQFEAWISRDDKPNAGAAPEPTPVPEPTAAPEPTTRYGAATAHLALLMGVDTGRAAIERRRVHRLRAPALRERAANTRLTEHDRIAAQWELDRRAANRAGDPWPPQVTELSTPAPAPEPEIIEPTEPVVRRPLVVTPGSKHFEAAVTGDARQVPAPVENETPAMFGRVTDHTVNPNNPAHLEAVRDSLRAIRDDMDPQDYERSPRTMAIQVDRNGNVQIQPMHHSGMGEPMRLTRNARSQLASFILGAHGATVLDRLAKMSLTAPKGADALQLNRSRNAGASLVSNAWGLAAHQFTDPLRFRSVRRGSGRTVRAVLSQTYAVYDHLDLIEDTLAALGSDADRYRVIQHDMDDTVGRIRLIGGDDATLQAWESKAIDKPFPIIDLRNSETGQSAVYAQGGTFTLWCSNGCGTWDNDARYRWNHTGRTSDRIRNGLSHALDEIRVRSSQLVAAYDEALAVQISDTMAWFDAAFADSVSQTQRDAIANTLITEDTVHRDGDSPRLLASLVDAVTFQAHEQSTLAEQARLEQLGATILRDGLTAARDRRIVVGATA